MPEQFLFERCHFNVSRLQSMPHKWVLRVCLCIFTLILLFAFFGNLREFVYLHASLGARDMENSVDVVRKKILDADNFQRLLHGVDLSSLEGSIHKQNLSVLLLYGAKSSGSSGKMAYNMVHGEDSDNFINDPYNSRLWLANPPKILSSHYICAIEQYNRAIQFAQPTQLIVFTIREAVSTIQSSMQEVAHFLCYELLQHFGDCTLELIDFLNYIKEKPREMALTSIDCLDFRKLEHSLTVTRGTVCFGNVEQVNNLVRDIVERENMIYHPMNLDSEKSQIFIRINANETQDIKKFTTANWVKIISGLRYELQREFKWLSEQLALVDFLCTTKIVAQQS